VILRGFDMTNVVEGGKFSFSVAFTNASGRVLSTPVPSDAAATIDRADAGTVAVNLDGSAGVFTASAVDGPVNLTAKAGGFTSAPFELAVVPDPVPAAVVIVPA
jgi:hypothetical protein